MGRIRKVFIDTTFIAIFIYLTILTEMILAMAIDLGGRTDVSPCDPGVVGAIPGVSSLGALVWTT